MTTDWMLIRRAATELEAALRGARLDDAGLLEDGRVALRFGGVRRGPATLVVDAFGTPPLVTLEDAEPALAADPGWLRAASTALRGMRLSTVQARRGDRLLVLLFGSASRFGVESGARLVLELVPRYGNVLVLRERTVVAAAKQFSPAENPERSVQVGMPYQPPPLPLVRLPRALEASLVADGRDGDADATAVLWREAEAAAEQLGPIHVYRDETGALLAAHVVPLDQFAAAIHDQEPLLLPLWARERGTRTAAQLGDRRERLRASLASRVARRREATAEELQALRERQEDAARRDRLRASGDALFTHAHEVPGGATTFVPATNPTLTIALDPELDGKANALRYYAQYRKATDALPHLERRAAALRARAEALDELAFEVERASDGATLAELTADLDALEGRPAQRAAAPGRKRAPLRVDRPSGARIYVGRSPRENAEVTFRIARPDDLWFHARGMPGSHVVLQAPAGGTPADDDLAAAADLAAAHSRGRAAGRVEVDYTERKHVRKQRDAAPGLVWYTHARTRLGVVPADYAPVESASRNAATTRGS
ncbi:MAG TPA: NFACT RNA binding domain-containing protein [Candidatus Sulfotelmatobacter sp.]|nr:NFACT RNA binding domain-containing protein [Candidatus Sulfotelmatobacter sp.]